MPAAGSADERWSLGALPPEGRDEGWRDVVAETHLPWRIASTAATGPAYDAWVRRRRIGPLSVLDCGCDPCAGSRGVREIAGSRGEYVGALTLLAGGERITQGGRDAALGAGQMVLWDGVRPAEFAVGTRLHKRTVLVPRELLAWRVPALTRRTAVRLAGPRVALLAGYLAAVLDGPPLDADGADAAALAAVELLAAAAAETAPPSGATVRAAALARARRHVEAHLGDPGLGTATLAGACGVSVRTLQAAFQEAGDSPSAYIRRRRLERCHEALRAGPPGPVFDVALRFGFRSHAHFTRLFRAAYDATPSEVARRARRAA
jgi:AraC-like DNA-binding protein